MKKGFTLVEFAMVMTVVAIIAVVYTPRFGSNMRDVELESWRRKVKTAVLYARELAVDTGLEHGVICKDNSLECYFFVYMYKPGMEMEIVTDPLTRGEYKYYLYTNETKANWNVRFPWSYDIRFSSSGKSNQTSDYCICLINRDNDSKSVCIEANTGAVR